MARIGFDLAHSMLRPVVVAPGPEPCLCLRREAPTGAAPPAQSERLRILSWNIHRGYELGRLCASLAAILGDEQPDLLLLQEVPVGPGEPFWECGTARDLLAAYHVEYAAMHRVASRSPYYPFDHSGLATLSRLAPARSSVVQLPTVSRPKLGPAHTVRRVALRTVHAVGGLEVTVVNLHLENTTGPRGRRLQVGHLLAAMTPAPDPVIVGGDFNTVLGRLEGVGHELERQGLAQVPFAAGPRLLPRLDLFFVRGCRAQEVRTLRAGGSDHAPIVVEVELSSQSR